MRTRQRPRGPIRQPAQPASVGIPAQPRVHRLTRHPIPTGHLGDRGPLLQDLQHRPIPLLHDTQLHQHTRLPPPRSMIAAKGRSTARRRGTSTGVAHLPERLSPTYRNRVHKLSPRNRNQGVQHEPESHTSASPLGSPTWLPSKTGRRLVGGDLVSDLRFSLEPPVGIEPTTCSLRETRPPAPDALAARKAGRTRRLHTMHPLSTHPVHDPFHGSAGRPAWASNRQ